MTKEKKSEFKIKGPYDPVDEVDTNTIGISMTQQQFKDECDINNILRRYAEYGTCDHMMRKEGRYVDCSDITAKTFQEHLDFMLDFEEHFDSLPEKVREYFDDDPTMLMEYLADGRNYDKLSELGVLKRKDKEASEPISEKEPTETPASVSSENVEPVA